MGDLTEKYQILANEYAKLKSQIAVLKKAVIDERNRQGRLSDDVVTKDVKIRKLQQELEGVTFRNDQLSKRVGVLQKEIHEKDQLIRSKVSHIRKKSNELAYLIPSNINSSGENENTFLQNKIFEQNLRLQQEISDYEIRWNQLVSCLSDLRKSAAAEKSSLKSIRTDFKTYKDGISKDMNNLDFFVNKIIQFSSEELSKKQHSLTVTEERSKELQTDLNSAQKKIQKKLYFDDTQFGELNHLNIPTFDKQTIQKDKEIHTSCSLFTSQIFESFLNIFSYIQQRINHFHGSFEPFLNVNDTTEKTSPLFNEKLIVIIGKIKNVKDCSTEYFSIKPQNQISHGAASENGSFLNTFDKFIDFVSFLENSLPTYLDYLRSEDKVFIHSSDILDNGNSLITSLEMFVGQLSGVCSIYKNNDFTIDSSSQILSALNKLIKSSKDIYKFYSLKIDFEKEEFKVRIDNINSILNNQDSSSASKKNGLSGQRNSFNQLVITNECFLSALNSLIGALTRLSAYLHANVDDIVNYLGGGRIRGGSFQVSSSISSARYKFWADLNQEMLSRRETIQGSFDVKKNQLRIPPSVSYEDALRYKQYASSSEESLASFTKQLTELQTKVKELEKEKEHWLLEAQLSKIRLEKQSTVANATVATAGKKNILSATPASGSPVDSGSRISGGDSIHSGADQSAPEGDSIRSVSIASLHLMMESEVAKISLVEDEDSALEEKIVEADAREETIRRVLTTRINKLNALLQANDSKTFHLLADCQALHTRLQFSENARKKVQSQLEAATNTISSLKDELETTSRSYEEKLSLMSEHLAAMNEKYTAQTDQVEELKRIIEMMQNSNGTPGNSSGDNGTGSIIHGGLVASTFSRFKRK